MDQMNKYLHNLSIFLSSNLKWPTYLLFPGVFNIINVYMCVCKPDVTVRKRIFLFPWMAECFPKGIRILNLLLQFSLQMFI